MRSGHISGSKNLPFADLVNAETGELKEDKELALILREKGIDTTKDTINSCGSGVTACILDLALRINGAERSSIYDGSWSEYVSLKGGVNFFKDFSLTIFVFDWDTGSDRGAGLFARHEAWVVGAR